MKSAALLAAALIFLPVSPAFSAEASRGHAVQAQSETEKNRAIITDFIDMFYGQKKPREAFEKYVAADYIQHNPGAPDGREATLALLEPFMKSMPDRTTKVLRILVDGDLAAVHSRGAKGPDDRGMAIVDIFRLKDGKIVEHWDVLQPVPEQSANPHPMF